MNRLLVSVAAIALLAYPAEAQIVMGNGGSGGGGSGTVTSITAGNGILVTPSPITTTGVVGTTVTNNAQIGTTYAVLATDGGKVVSASNSSSEAYSIAAANTTGFTSGFGFDLNNIGAGVTTLTATTSLFDNGLTTLALVKGQDAYIYSDGANYHSVVSMPVLAVDNVLGNFSGASNYPIAGALTSCSAASSALTYNTSTHAFGCNTISGGGSGTVNSGTTPNGAYYATTGTAVSDGGAANVTFGGINVAAGVSPANGIYLNTTGVLGISAAGAVRMTVGAGVIKSLVTMDNTTNGVWVGFGSGAASATNPTFGPNLASTTTGWGAQATGNMSAVISATETERFTSEGILSIQATPPAVTGTGTPTIATGSTDEVGEVTSGATATSVVITFNKTHTNAPFCNVTPQTQLVAFAYTISNTAVTITQTATSGDKIDYRCSFH